MGVGGLGIARHLQTQHAKQVVVQNTERLIRMHSPVIGLQSALVTIVDFFNPACETFRAVWWIVKRSWRSAE